MAKWKYKYRRYKNR